MGRKIINKWKIKKYRREVESERIIFRRYGFKEVFLGRLLGKVRCKVKMVDGMM